MGVLLGGQVRDGEKNFLDAFPAVPASCFVEDGVVEGATEAHWEDWNQLGMLGEESFQGGGAITTGQLVKWSDATGAELKQGIGVITGFRQNRLQRRCFQATQPKKFFLLGGLLTGFPFLQEGSGLGACGGVEQLAWPFPVSILGEGIDAPTQQQPENAVSLGALSGGQVQGISVVGCETLLGQVFKGFQFGQ